MMWLGVRAAVLFLFSFATGFSWSLESTPETPRCELYLRPRLYSNLSTDAASFQLNQQREQELLAGATPTVKVRATTINLNLVKNIFARNPIYRTSRQDMVNALEQHLLESESPDVVLAQEIWEHSDHEALKEAAERAGFLVLVQDADQLRRTGLQILVKKSLGATIEPAQFTRFTNGNGFQIRAFWERIGGVQRGILWASLLFADGTRILLVNTHMTPLTFHQRERDHQLKSLERKLPIMAKDSDALILAGDLNIAADYDEARGAELRRVERERKIYESFFARFGWIDTFRTKNNQVDNPGYTTNIHFPNTLALQIWPEVEKRIDYIFASELGGRLLVYVQESKLIFTEPQTLSDHFGIQSSLQFFRK